jgi:hypothetical protein
VIADIRKESGLYRCITIIGKIMAEVVTWKNATAKQRVRGLAMFLVIFGLIFGIKAGWPKIANAFSPKVDMTQLAGVKWTCKLTDGSKESTVWLQFNRDRQTVYDVVDAVNNPESYLIGRFASDAQANTVNIAFSSIALGHGLGYDSVVRASDPPGYGRLSWDLQVTKLDNGRMRFKGTESGVHIVEQGLVHHALSADCSAP